jgi:tetratricopeptide (TPR) repeat protein
MKNVLAMTHRSLIGGLLFAVVAAGCSGDPREVALSHTVRGDSFAADGQYDAAAIEYGRALQVMPDAVDVRFKLAQAYESAGEVEKAQREFVEVAKLDPRHAAAQVKTGMALLAAGDFANARTRAQLAIDADPGLAAAYVLLGNALAGLNDSKAAVAQFEQALALDPQSSTAWTSVGAMHFREGQRREAAQAFAKAVSVAPESTEAKLALAHFHWATGDVAGAERSMKEALAQNPSSAEAHRALGALYVATQRISAAEPHVRALATDAPGQLALVDYLVALERYDEANAILLMLESQRDERMVREARIRSAEILHATNKRAEAHQLIDEALAAHPDDGPLHLSKARLLLAEGAATGDVSAHARKALAAAPSSPAPHYVLGLAALFAGDTAAATQAFEEVVRINPRAAPAHMQLARIHLASREPSKAVSAAKRAVDENPRNSEATALLARGLRSQGNVQRASEELQEALAKGPRPALLLEKGWLALQTRNYAAARTAFADAAADAASVAEARDGLIAVHIAEKNFDGARASLRQWRGGSDNDPRLQLLAAQVELAAGQFDAAARELGAANAAGDDSVEVHELLAKVYAAQGKTTDAVAEYERVAARFPTAASAALTNVGMLHDGQQNAAAARAAYEQALRVNPNAGIAANNLAWIYAREGRLQEALKLATVANEALGGRAETQHTLGWIYYQLRLAPQAIRAFDSARRLAPNRAIYHYHAGLAHLQAGDESRAKAALERALALNTTFEGVADAKVQLAALQR